MIEFLFNHYGMVYENICNPLNLTILDYDHKYRRIYNTMIKATNKFRRQIKKPFKLITTSNIVYKTFREFETKLQSCLVLNIAHPLKSMLLIYLCIFSGIPFSIVIIVLNLSFYVVTLYLIFSVCRSSSSFLYQMNINSF